jgi:cation diffusion facilitator CzcD-associated flavoprotein CzcO
MRDVLVIGAGPAGLSSGYYLQKAGIDFEIVDRADHIGSTWAHLYPSLKLNTASIVSHMPGQPMPLHYPLLPSGRQYYAHLTDWVRRHPLPVHLSVQVKRVSPAASGWYVETSAGDAEYRAVIIASGRFGNPYIPPIPGMETFTGTLLHAHDFHDPADFAGKRVLIVGNGPSGADAAVALAAHSPGNVLLAIRSDMVIARRNPYGINETLWKILIHRLPQRWQKPLSDRLLFQSYPDVHTYGLPLAPNRDDRKGTSVPIRGPEFLRELRAGRIRAVRGLASLQGRCAVLEDGSAHEVDVVLLATGYRPVLDYLDIDFDTDDQGWPLRATESDIDNTQLRGYPGLYLVGRYYRGLGAFYNIRQEARQMAREVSAYLAS